MCHVSSKAFLFAAGLGVSMLTAPSYGVQILLNAEGDIGTTATDKLIVDGSQNPTFHAGTPNGVAVDNNPANAAYGNSSFSFQGLVDENIYGMNRLGLPDTATLGSSFTLGAFIKSSFDGQMQLFSSYVGGGPVGNTLQFAVNAGAPGAWTRMYLDVAGERAQTSTWGSVSTGDYYLAVVTFDAGEVKFYFDGVLRETITLAISAYENGDSILYVGNNTVAGASQLNGSVDDIFVLDRVLSDSEIANIKANGATAVLVPEPAALGLLLVAGGMLARRRSVGR